MHPVAPLLHPIHWQVLCFMLLQLDGAGGGRAALAAAGLLLLQLARTVTCCPPRLQPCGLPIGQPRRLLLHWHWLCCACLCQSFEFSGTTVMNVRLPGPAKAASA